MHSTKLTWLKQPIGLLLLFGFILLACRMIWYTFGQPHPRLTNLSLGPPTMLFLTWNAFLAWIPYGVSQKLAKKEKTDLFAISLLAIWLLFLPNSPYLLTDFVHLKSRPPIPWWYDLLLLTTFAIIGFWLAIKSLQNVHQWISEKHSTQWSFVVISVSLCLTGFGVFIGRFGRWNSWDVFTQPGALLEYFQQFAAHPLEPLLFTFLWGVFMNILFFTFGIKETPLSSKRGKPVFE